MFLILYIYTSVDPCIPCTKQDGSGWRGFELAGFGRPFGSMFKPGNSLLAWVGLDLGLGLELGLGLGLELELEFGFG